MTRAPSPKAKPPSETSPPPEPKRRGRPRKDVGAAPDPIPRAPDEPDLFAGWIGEEAFARQRGLSVHSLRAERRRPDGPPYTKDGPRVFYSVQGFRLWLAARETKPGESGGDSS